MLFKLLLFLGAFHVASSKRMTCEVIEIPLCKSIGYNLTSMPNMFNHETQEEAALEIHQYWPLVEINCSSDLRFFLCSMYAPKCQPNFKDKVPPCRSLCERARKGCEPLLRQYGFPWPKRMKCEKFPKLGDRLCLNGNNDTANHTKTVPPTELTTTSTNTKKNCQQIRIPLCQNIGYNLTSMPNMFDHDTQEAAALEIHQFWPLVESKCSPDLRFFLCSVYAPACHPNSKDEVLPCRSICRRARKGCAPFMRQYGFSFPERMRCRNFPKDKGDGLCHYGINRPLLSHASSPACKKIIDGNQAITLGVLGGLLRLPLAYAFMLLAAIFAIGQLLF